MAQFEVFVMNWRSVPCSIIPDVTWIGHIVTLFVEALRYKPGDRELDSG